MRILSLCRVLILVAGSLSFHALAALSPVAPYDPDPNHLWNRLHRAIFIRTTGDGTQLGQDVIDPLVYMDSKFLREGKSHEILMGVLKEFLESGARQINDPVKRAILQRDLWVVFDWAQHGSPYQTAGADSELMTPLAKAIRQLALSSEQIGKLPDCYALAVESKQFAARYDPEKPNEALLPDDLLSADGPWVALVDGDRFAPKTHVRDFNGRHAFDVFLNLPDGRKATVEYLSALQRFEKPIVEIPPHGTEKRTLVELNPKLPAPPAGTKFALLRRTMVIDRERKIRSTPLVESLQIRVIRQTPHPAYRTATGRRVTGEEDAFEFQRSRAKLFAGKSGGLRAIGAEDAEPHSPFFRAHVFDPLELRDNNGLVSGKRSLENNLLSCADCHSGGPLHSFQTLDRFPGFPGAKLPRLTGIDGDIFERDASAVIAWKIEQKDWKALVELMNK